MRNGRLVHRRAHASRFAFGAQSPLERLQSLSAFGSPRAVPRLARSVQVEASAWKMQRLQLGSRLPINLRHFLAEQLGSSMRVEDDSIVALEPRSNEALMRELARAIRRFSTERAREAWCECAMGLDRLEREFSPRPATTADRWCCACDARAWAPVLSISIAGADASRSTWAPRCARSNSRANAWMGR